jgi:Family of unknown function (DUF6510)
MQMEEIRLDGNAAGGLLREVFAREMTGALATCTGCGDTGPVGALMNYGNEMGAILRCVKCNSVMLRIVVAPGWLRVDASGTAMLAIPDRGYVP